MIDLHREDQGLKGAAHLCGFWYGPLSKFTNGERPHKRRAFPAPVGGIASTRIMAMLRLLS